MTWMKMATAATLRANLIFEGYGTEVGGAGTEVEGGGTGVEGGGAPA